MPRNWNKILSYQTLKVITIEDKRLGLLHWAFTFFIAGYVIGYVFVYNKGYLKYADVSGIIYMNILPPSAFNLDLKEYCTNDKSSNPAFNPQPCEIWSAYALSTTTDLSDSWFLATQVERVKQTRDCSNFFDPVLQYRGCNANWTNLGNLTTYVGGVEEFVLSITHNAFAPEHSKSDTANENYKGSSFDMTGYLLNLDKSEHELPPGANNFTLGELLASVSNDQPIVLDRNCTHPQCIGTLQTFRQAGVVLVLEFEYRNDHQFLAPTHLEYVFSISRMPDAAYTLSTLEDVDVHGANQSQTVRTVHGVRLDFIKSGQIGAVDVLTIFSVAIESLVLLKIAGVLVDWTATKIMAHRKTYSSFIKSRAEDKHVKMRKRRLSRGEPLAENEDSSLRPQIVA